MARNKESNGRITLMVFKSASLLPTSLLSTGLDDAMEMLMPSLARMSSSQWPANQEPQSRGGGYVAS